MAGFKPHEYKTGDSVNHVKLNETDEAVARNQLISGPNATLSQSIQGMSIDAGPSESSVVVGYMVTITESLTPCIGVHPAFTFGVGRGFLLKILDNGTSDSDDVLIDVYNSLPESVPARDWPVQAKLIGPLVFADVAPCSVP